MLPGRLFLRRRRLKPRQSWSVAASATTVVRSLRRARRPRSHAMLLNHADSAVNATHAHCSASATTESTEASGEVPGGDAPAIAARDSQAASLPTAAHSPLL